MKRILVLLLTGVGLAAAACGSVSSPTGGSVQQAQGGEVSTALSPAHAFGASGLVASSAATRPFHAGPQAVAEWAAGTGQTGQDAAPPFSAPA
jgi:hypothetical protein